MEMQRVMDRLNNDTISIFVVETCGAMLQLPLSSMEPKKSGSRDLTLWAWITTICNYNKANDIILGRSRKVPCFLLGISCLEATYT